MYTSHTHTHTHTDYACGQVIIIHLPFLVVFIKISQFLSVSAHIVSNSIFPAARDTHDTHAPSDSVGSEVGLHILSHEGLIDREGSLLNFSKFRNISSHQMLPRFSNGSSFCTGDWAKEFGRGKRGTMLSGRRGGEMRVLTDSSLFKRTEKFMR